MRVDLIVWTDHDGIVINYCLVSTLQGDVKGINAAKNYWQAYFDKYTYEHEVLAGAVDKEDTTAFSFWLDRVSIHVVRSKMHSSFQACSHMFVYV